jgi:hypothetical protein
MPHWRSRARTITVGGEGGYKERAAIKRVNVLGDITHEEARYLEDQITDGQMIRTGTDRMKF